jgi:3-dehydroquinate synthase
MIRIPIRLGDRSYSVSVGLGLVDSLPSLLDAFKGRPIVVVSNLRVWSLHGESVGKALGLLGRYTRLLIRDGEVHKSPATVERLHTGFLDAGLTRDGLVVAFGGGVVGDVAGFAAATYMRGVALVHLPTTLLAMVDSSIGGKVGVNHPKAKNLIGAFHQPRAVLVDPSFLTTLPPRELQGGLYEVLKCAVIGDRRLFRSLAHLPTPLNPPADLVGLIEAACRLKAHVVETDERELGFRRVLNLGHTVGHALEAVTLFRRFTHGEAVGWGLLAAISIARDRKLLKENDFASIATAVERIGPRPGLFGVDPERVLEAVQRDKKKRDGRVSFVLPTAVGRVVTRSDVSKEEVRGALRSLASWVSRPLPGGRGAGPSGRGAGSRPRRRRSTGARR